MRWIGFFSTLMSYLHLPSESISRIINPTQVQRKEDPQYVEVVKKIFSLLDDKKIEEATTLAGRAGISTLEFEDLRTIHFWDWDN